MRRRRGTATGREHGSATAELAVVLPSLVLVTVLCLWALASVSVHLSCLDAARTGARGLARGEPTAQVVDVVQKRAPRGARVRVDHLDGELVAVEVTVRVSVPGPWSEGGPGLTVGGRAVAVAEGALGAR